ncbi:hypothetical protein JB92DRAFT_3080771 [Gautieria morchelliformis]|nr:hypothetical protein JB92DRAFT_3080771 [Gautieria morchelliformis]
MSRALGAAFLSHQVEQLEKTVGRESRSTASNNWRERSGQLVGGRGGKRGGAAHAQGHQGGRKKERKDGREVAKPREQSEPSGSTELEKDADTIVVDASVLVHALGQVKKWCKDGRQEVILIPLEALNTLDLLKKGSSPLAQRARAASRILESQVGTNPRIRVQRDDAFVLWDEIPFRSPLPGESLTDPESNSDISFVGLAPPPEWLRRTICCGRWEMMNASLDSTSYSKPTSLTPLDGPLSRSSTPTSSATPSYAPVRADIGDQPDINGQHVEGRVVLAVVTTATTPSPGTGSSLDTSTIHPGRYERADGSLVRMWAQHAGMEVLEVDPTATPVALPPHHPPSSPERRRPHTHGQERRVLRESRESGVEREGERRPSLVEKPIAMAIVNEQPVKVLRVLARGEKLDP